jgi:tetraacyldisaccharide-1-P 4'-kinase
MSKPKKSVKALQAEIARLSAALHELNKTYTFKHKPGRPIMVVQIGDAETGWIGNTATVAFLIRELKQAGVDEVYNIVIYHYAAKFTILEGNRPQYIR